MNDKRGTTIMRRMITDNIKKHLRKNNIIVGLYSLLRCREVNKYYRDKLAKELEWHYRNKRFLGLYIFRFCFDCIKYEISPDEYFLFRFIGLNDIGKKEYIGENEKHRICTELGNSSVIDMFDNKYETYRTFKKYYGRSVEIFDQNSKISDLVYWPVDIYGNYVVW